MAIYKENIIDVELTAGTIHRSFAIIFIGEGDDLADVFGVRVFRNGAAVDLTGVTVAGYFIRADGETVPISSGSVSGNVASVTLEESCYAIEGQFSLSIKLSSGDVTGTVRIVDGVVVNTTTSTVVDPGTIIPSIEDLIATIIEVRGTIPDEYSTLNNSVYIGDESIESNVEKITGARSLVFRQGKYVTPSTTIIGETASYADDADYCCAICACSEGDKFTATINGPTGKQRAWFFCDADMKVLSRAAANVNLSNTIITAPENAAFITFTNVLSARPSGYYAYKGTSILDRAITSAGTVTAASMSNDIDNAPRNTVVTITGTVASACAHSPFSNSYYLLTYAPSANGTSCVQIAVPYSDSSNTVIAVRKVNSSSAFSDWMFIPRTIITEPISTASSGNDHTSIIQEMLNTYGFCQLGKGNYFVTNLVMPAGSVLAGFGDSTVLLMKSSANGPAITMGDRCIVRDLKLAGDVYDLTLDGHFTMSPVSDSSVTNKWTEGAVQIANASGYVHIVLSNPIPAGSYHMSAIAEPDSGVSRCYIGFSTSQDGSIGPSNIIEEAEFTANLRQDKWLTFTDTVYSVRVCASSTASMSEGHTATWSDISIRETGNRSGIAWNDSDAQYGKIQNCTIFRFNCAAILAHDTGSPVDHNLMIENCTMFNNNVGLYIRNNSEFNKITNCTITRNYFGILNRGGNNVISNCGVDANVVGIQIDEDYSSNAGHGCIDNCTINHSDSNNGYGLIIRDTGREVISNCCLFYSKVRLQNTNGNILTGCQFGNNAVIEITGGACSLANGCIFVTTTENPVTAYNNTAAKAVNCYRRNGDAVGITSSDSPI